MSKQRKKYSDMSMQEVRNQYIKNRAKHSGMSEAEVKKEYLTTLLGLLSDEQLKMLLVVSEGLEKDNYDIMPESALEFFATNEEASEESKEKARIALAKKRGELIEQSC